MQYEFRAYFLLNKTVGFRSEQISCFTDFWRLSPISFLEYGNMAVCLRNGGMGERWNGGTVVGLCQKAQNYQTEGEHIDLR